MINLMSFYLYITVLLFFISACHSTRKENFEQVEVTIDSLTDMSSYKEAIRFLEEVKSDYPSNEYEIIQNLAVLYGKSGEYDKSFRLWSDGHKKGYFFGLFSHFPIYERFKNYPQFDSICKEDMRIRKDSLAHSKTIYELITPKNYNPLIKYPLIIILHGGGSSIKNEKRYWKSEKLQKEFIVAFLQSYLYYDMKTFGWKTTDERGRNDLMRCYDEIKSSYSVDPSEVLIGGISAGGYMAMDISINKYIPTIGFIAICPDVMPNDFNLESIETAKLSGIRGVIISGEKDYTLKNQEALLNKFNEADFKYTYEVVLGIGHEYPPDFENRIESILNTFL